MSFPSIFAILVGSMMIGWWLLSYVRRQIPDLETEPYAIGFHLAGEFATAITMVIAGIGLWVDQSWGNWLFLVAAGMLTYTVIVSPGYFIQRGRWPLAIMFALLLAASIISIALLI